MREVLVILTKKEPLVAEVADLQRQFPEQKVEVLDFTQGEPNYDDVLQRIFQADSVQVW